MASCVLRYFFVTRVVYVLEVLFVSCVPSYETDAAHYRAIANVLPGKPSFRVMLFFIYLAVDCSQLWRCSCAVLLRVIALSSDLLQTTLYCAAGARPNSKQAFHVKYVT